METLHLDAYVIDSLMPELVGRDRQPSAFLVYLYLWRSTWGRERAEEHLTFGEIAKGTGLSRKVVEQALNRLMKRQLVSARREHTSSVPLYAVRRPWAATR